MNFEYPLIFAAPLAILLFHLTNKRESVGALLPSILNLKELPSSAKILLRIPTLLLFSTAFIVLFTSAAARPQNTSVVEDSKESRNLILAIDLSRSMATTDFGTARGTINRMEGVKSVVDEFLQVRASDRIGIVVFGASAFVQAPLTKDHHLLRELVKKLQYGIAGDATAIGDGLGLSLKRLADIPSEAKAVILITDGVDNASRVLPMRAAEVAKDLGVKVHTIGIGSVNPPSPSFQDLLRGSAVGAEFDEATLKAIAEKTGGLYSNASNLDGLKAVYNKIDELERTNDESELHVVVEELFSPLLAGSLAAYALYLTLAYSIFSKVP